LWQSRRLARGCRAEQGSAARKSVAAVAVSEQAEVADANQAAGKHMQEEAAQELMSGNGHDLLLAAMGIVAPEERDPAITKADQSMVGNSDAMRVSGQIIQHEVGTAEGRLGVDDPVLVEPVEKPLEGAGVGNFCDGSVELELAILI